MLEFGFYIKVAQYAFCAFTMACLVTFVYSFIEQMFPDRLLSRATVTYGAQGRKIGFPLIAVGFAGLLVSLFIYASEAAMSGTLPHYVIFGVSAVIFDAGVWIYLKSAVTRARPGMVLID